MSRVCEANGRLWRYFLATREDLKIVERLLKKSAIKIKIIIDFILRLNIIAMIRVKQKSHEWKRIERNVNLYDKIIIVCIWFVFRNNLNEN